MTGFLCPQMIFCNFSTISGAKYCPPVSGHTLAGTCSTRYPLALASAAWTKLLIPDQEVGARVPEDLIEDGMHARFLD